MTKITNGLLTIAFLTIAAIAGVIGYYVAIDPLTPVIGRVLVVATGAGLVVAVIIGLSWLYGYAATGNAQRSAAARRAHAEAARIEREADTLVTTAPAGHQVYLTSERKTFATTPLHLAPGPVNGSKQLVTVSELNRWQLHQLAHNTAKLGGGQSGAVPLLEGPAERPQLEPILPLLVKAQRLILVGGSDAGKTTLVKWIISGRADHSRIIPIDPHAPSKILGYNVIGAGMEWQEIGAALESLCLLMAARYQDVKAGTLGYGQHERISVFVDEWTSISKYVPSAGDYLESLLTQSRKVNIHLTFCTHSTTVDVLGIDAQIRKSATIVQLTGGNGQPRRAFIEPASKLTPDGTKARPVEYALPGPFAGFVAPRGEVIKALPDARVIKAQMMSDAGETVTAIARAFFDTARPNSRQISEIKSLLKRTTEARQAHDT